MTTASDAVQLPQLDIDTIVQRLAKLAVEHAANVQPGQTVVVGSELGKEQLTRAVVAAAYRAGAGFVDVSYQDPHVWHARVQHADPETLEQFPDWYRTRTVAIGEHRCATIGLSLSTSLIGLPLYQ